MGPTVGPMPPTQNDEDEEDRIMSEFERREERMKQKLSGNDPDAKPIEREEWMTELPSIRTVKNLKKKNNHGHELTSN